MTAHLAHVLNTATIWLLLGSALRLAVTSGARVTPTAIAGWNVLWCNKEAMAGCQRALYRRADDLYMNLLTALTTPTSAVMLYGGLAALGTGLSITLTGSLLRLLELRIVEGDVMRWVGTAPICVGIALVMASISTRRTLSLWISGALIFAGLGIGVVTGTMHGS